MAEYIEKNVAIARLTALEIGNPCATMTDAKRQIADTRAADVAPVVHGRWIDAPALSETTCSVCRKTWNCCDNNTEEFFFCPACGAKMDLEEKNETD